MAMVLLGVWTGLWTGTVYAQGTPYAPASQAEVNAGVNGYKAVTPKTLAAWPGEGTNLTEGGVIQIMSSNNAATATLATTALYGPGGSVIVTNNLFNEVSFLDFCGTNTPHAPMLVQDNVNAHGWYDESSNLQFALNWCATNTLGKTTLFLPPGIYRVAASNKLSVPPSVNIAGVGFLHYGIEDAVPDLPTTNYSMVWFDNTNATGVWFDNITKDIGSITGVQIEGYTNPVATYTTLETAPFSQLGIAGLTVCDTNIGWSGGFTARNVSVSGFRIGVAVNSGLANFDHCVWILNGIGLAATSQGNGYMANSTNAAIMPTTAYYWSNCLSYFPGFPAVSPDQLKITDCGGGFRPDGLVYWLDSGRGMEINHDTSYSFHGLLVDGSPQPVSFHDSYMESYEQGDMATNPIILLGGTLDLNNFLLNNANAAQNNHGDYMTNSALVECDPAPNSYCVVELNNVSFQNATTYELSTLVKTFDAALHGDSADSVFCGTGVEGWYEFVSTSGLLNQFTLLKNGSTYNGHANQMNNEYSQYGPLVTTNLSAQFIGGVNYGRPILQRGVPDYLSMIVRSNSIGNGIIEAPYESNWSPTNGVYYWTRYLQSDYPGMVKYNSTTKSWDIEQDYTADILTVRSNYFDQYGALPASTNIATISYVNTATNGFVTATVTNGLATVGWVQSTAVSNNDTRILNFTNVQNTMVASNLSIAVPSGGTVGMVFTLTNATTGAGTWSNAPAGGGSVPSGIAFYNVSTNFTVTNGIYHSTLTASNLSISPSQNNTTNNSTTFVITGRYGASALTNFPVPTIEPFNTNEVLALDISPSAGYTGTGFSCQGWPASSWFDVGSTDTVATAGTPGVWAHLWAAPNGDAGVGSVNYGSSLSGKFYFLDCGVEYMEFNNNNSIVLKKSIASDSNGAENLGSQPQYGSAFGTVYAVSGMNMGSTGAGDAVVTTAGVGNVFMKTNAFVQGIMTATNGIASYATDTNIVSTTGWTNALLKSVVLDDVTGLSVIKYNNAGTAVANYGTITTGVSIQLQPGGKVIGTSMAGDVVAQ